MPYSRRTFVRCVFSFVHVVRKVRDTTVRQPNRERKRKRLGRGRGDSLLSPSPPPSFSVLTLVQHQCLCYFENHKRTPPPPPPPPKKNPPGTQATLYPSWKLWRDFIPKYQVEIREGVSLPLVVSWYVGLLQETKQCERSKSKKEYRRRHRQPVQPAQRTRNPEVGVRCMVVPS